MLLKVEVKNFESHEHAVLDLDAGFNLIVGPSNSGKSALLRAIRLCGYNEWNPESLRKGAKSCEVSITTEKGKVKVKRGASLNEWEVTPNGQPTKKFSRPGKGVVEEAADVIGLRVVKLGTQEVRPNVMDQLEGHFMMAEIEGEPTSGSTRAQVIDEISGLAGMEDLIRQVNLDNVRNAREIKEGENSIKDLTSQLHDQTKLDAEEKLLDVADKLITDYKEAKSFVDVAIDLLDRNNTAKTELQTSQKSLKGIPNVAAAEKSLQKAQENISVAVSAQEAHETAKNTANNIKVAIDELNNIPDTATASQSLDSAKEQLQCLKSVNSLMDAAIDVATQLETAETSLGGIPDCNKAETNIDNALRKLESLSVAKDMIKDSQNCNKNMADLRNSLKTSDSDLEKANNELTEADGAIDICPICLGPRHEGCKHGS